MTPEETQKKRLLFILMIAYFIIGYFGCSYINLNRSHYFDVGFSFERDIPFVPVFILGYLAVYLAIIATYLLIDDYGLMKQTAKLFFIVSTVHFILFLAVPVKMIRPDLANATGIMNLLTKYYYMIDNPVNCFSSLHVSYPLTGALLLWNYRRRWGYFILALTTVVAISVILVKQHYILDVVGGVAITSALFWIFKMRCPTAK